MSLIENLKWRYATKKFDPTKKVNPEHLEQIKEAVQLSATSFGLQLYKVLIIEDAELKAKLQPASWGQTQIVDASHLFVFCHFTEVKPHHIDDFISLKSAVQGMDITELKGYGDFVKSKMSGFSPEQQAQWTAKQTYIALGNLLAACGELHIDSCPMEGFDADEYNEILDLEKQGLSASVLAAVGYRSDEDPTKDAPKVRKAQEQIFQTL